MEDVETTVAIRDGKSGVVAIPLLDHDGCETTGDCLLRIPKLTVPQAAKMLGIGETKMRELIRNGDVPVLRIKDKILLLERDLERFLQSHYGPLRVVERISPKGLAPLPKHILESGLLKKAG